MPSEAALKAYTYDNTGNPLVEVALGSLTPTVYNGVDRGMSIHHPTGPISRSAYSGGASSVGCGSAPGAPPRD